MYENMKTMLADARVGGYAVGAFNMVNYLSADAIIQAAEELRSPVIVQTSVSTVNQIGIKKTIQMLKPLACDATVPVAIHLDHCTDPDFVISCIDSGWSSVMIDMSKHTLEKNIFETKKIVEYAKKKNVSVEGELGAIFGVEDDIKSNSSILATPEASVEYITTGVDAFAPAIGTAHGLYKGEPVIAYDLFENIAKDTACALVIHGGTGLQDNAFKELIRLGASKINVSTAVKIAYCGGMKEYLKEHISENNPLKLDKHAFNSIIDVVKEHIRIFGSDNKVRG